MAAGPGQIVGLIVGQSIGTQHDGAAPELDVADRFGVEFGTTVDLAGAQDDGQLPGRFAARRCLQRRRLAKLDPGGRACRGGRRCRSGRRSARSVAPATVPGAVDWACAGRVDAASATTDAASRPLRAARRHEVSP